MIFAPASDYEQHYNPSQRMKWVLQPGTVVFCDFDGPIVDVSERYYQTYRLSLAETFAQYLTRGERLQLSMLTKEQFWQLKCDRTPDIEIAAQSGLQGEQIDLFLQQVQQIVNRPALLHQDDIQPGVRWALSHLCNRGIQVVLVTLRQQEQVESIVHAAGLAPAFSGIFGAQDEQAAYQNHADHKTALLQDAIADAQRQGWCPGWMIGDTEADVLAGQALNMPTVSLTCGIRSRMYLEQFQPDLIHQNLLSAVHYLLGYRVRATMPAFSYAG